MTERLLQFIWQFQYFNRSELTSDEGEPLQIISPGTLNANQGPDFLDAKIQIGKTKWAGSIELHLKTSDWNKHKHTGDKNYKNVILHVVWEKDGSRNSVPAPGEQNSFPLLELKERVPKILLQRYEDLLNSAAFIACGKSIHTVKEITWKSWKERLLAERLMRKAKAVNQYLQQNNYHWEETFWWLLARNFGMKVNADAFEAIARSVSVNMLARQKSQVHQVEALLLGQAGLLEADFKENYPKLLQREYRFQQNKYKIKPVIIPVLFLRMRPGNFPTVRLAQLAMLVHDSAHLFSKIKEADDIAGIKNKLDVTANDYWHYHYRLDEESSFKKKKLGDAMVDNIVINTIAPVLFAYGDYHGQQQYKDKALQWLEETAAEENAITKGFQQTGIKSKNARDSQALIELKTQYCDRKRCLDCSIGNAILKA